MPVGRRTTDRSSVGARLARGSVLLCALLLGCSDDDAVTDAGALADSGSTGDAGATADGGSDEGDSGTEVDAGAEDPDAGPPAGPTILVALGTAGRTTVSCDGGHTWVADRSLDREGHASFCGMVQDVRCGSEACSFLSTFDDDACRMDEGCDCSHSPANARALTWVDGWFVQKVGWFGPAPVMRSRDGVTWEELDVVSSQSAGVARIGTRLVMTTHSEAFWSDDQGESWTTTEHPNMGHARTLVTVPWGEGELAVSIHDSVLRFSDGSANEWYSPTEMDEGCGEQAMTMISNGEVLVMPHRGNYVCRSDDGGLTFERVEYGGEHSPEGWIWDGEYFWLWSWRYGHRSTDGLEWERTDTVVEGRVGRTVLDPVSGDLVSWYNQYDAQRVSRSADGVTWEALDEAAYDRGQRIGYLVAGEAPAGFTCPTRE